MLTTWWKTWLGKIDPVSVVRETDEFVWLHDTTFSGLRRDRKSKKMSAFECYFPTWRQAHEHLMNEATRDAENARRALARAEERMTDVMMMMRDPTC